MQYHYYQSTGEKALLFVFCVVLLVTVQRGNCCCAHIYSSTISTVLEGKWQLCLLLLQYR
jgi:hypothetical protein